jgi:hypothetical protein
MNTCRCDVESLATATETETISALRARSERLLLVADDLAELAVTERWAGRGLEQVVDHLWQRGVQVAGEADTLAAATSC